MWQVTTATTNPPSAHHWTELGFCLSSGPDCPTPTGECKGSSLEATSHFPWCLHDQDRGVIKYFSIPALKSACKWGNIFSLVSHQ